MKHIKSNYENTQIERVPESRGESLEEMVRRCTANNEPIDATAPMIYTEKSKGVLAETDIRTDRMELALDAIDKFQKSEIAREKETLETAAKVEEVKNE